VALRADALSRGRAVPLQVQLVLAVVFGVAGWHHARHLEGKYGRPAWGMPSWVWGIITGFSLLLGVILLAIAERQLKKQPTPAAVPMQGYGMPPAYASAPTPTPAYAPAYAPVEVPAQVAPAVVQAVPVPAVAVPAVAVPAVAVPAVAPPAVPAGWQPDPSGKYEYRWWDGQAWTRSVSTGGVTGTDA